MEPSMKTLQLLLLMLLCTASAMAVCGGSSPNWTAASAAQTDITDCITAASPGDTLHIPSTSGSVTWPSTVVDNKGLNWVGAGSLPLRPLPIPTLRARLWHLIGK